MAHLVHVQSTNLTATFAAIQVDTLELAQRYFWLYQRAFMTEGGDAKASFPAMEVR